MKMPGPRNTSVTIPTPLCLSVPEPLFPAGICSGSMTLALCVSALSCWKLLLFILLLLLFLFKDFMFKHKDLENPTLLITSLGQLQPLPPHLALSWAQIPAFPTKNKTSWGGNPKLAIPEDHPRVAAHPGWAVTALGGCLFGK